MSDTVIKPSTAFKAVIHADVGGGYWAEVPELPGCFSQGDTLDIVYRNVQEAVASHLDLEVGQVRISSLEMAA